VTLFATVRPVLTPGRRRIWPPWVSPQAVPQDRPGRRPQALRTSGLRRVSVDDTTVALLLLADQLGRAHTDTVNRLHALLLEPIPGREGLVASDLIHDLTVLDKKTKLARHELTERVANTGSRLLELPGMDPPGAARLLGDVGDIRRFAGRAHFASWNGTAPIDAPSSDHNGTGSPASIGRCTSLAIVQLRRDTEGRRYYRRRFAEGEALRALKRRLSDVVYRQMLPDAKRFETGRGGHPGSDSDIQRGRPNPHDRHFGQVTSGPPNHSLEHRPWPPLGTEGVPDPDAGSSS
jgi:transposase IS116/IS110/IS902 family protein